MAKVRWGVLSTARIGTEKVIPAMQRCEFAEVTAIASRDLARGQLAASNLNIPTVYGSYEELLADPDVDAIYNPLPNHLHVEWSIRALQAGKHVLCEKPIGLSAAEGQQLVDASLPFPQLKLTEAFMYRHHPRWQRARQIVREGGVGRLRTIQSFFSYYNDDPNNIRNMSDIGGGGLMDIGCYPISLSRFLFEGEPIRVTGVADFDDRFRTDRLTSAIMEFEQGTATFTCSTQLVPYQRVHAFGDGGRLELEMPFNTPSDRACQMWHQKTGEVIEELVFPPCDQYTAQGDAVSRSILEDVAVPTPIQDAVANMRVIEAIFRSAKTGQWEAVGVES